MASYKTKVPKAKEGMRGIRDEVLTLDTAARRGASAVNIHKDTQMAKREALKDPETKDALMDFLFGKNTTNPLEDITDNKKEKLEILKSKKYEKNGIVGVKKEEY